VSGFGYLIDEGGGHYGRQQAVLFKSGTYPARPEEWGQVWGWGVSR
jgi:hypothetical protein